MNVFSKILLLAALALASCSKQIPEQFTKTDKFPDLYPDYNGVTIPCNIAPLNFKIKDTAEAYLSRFYSPDGVEFIVSGRKVQIKQHAWESLLESSKGKNYSVDVFLKKNNKWFKFKTITNQVVSDPIDEYLSYRLIEPGYMGYENITINQRNLTNFKTSEIYNNMKLSEEKDGQCVNCHSFQNYRTDNMQMHLRQNKGGTLIVNDGKVTKVNTKTEQTISGGVYTTWHPQEKLIVYSVNVIGQSFHSKSTEKVEVLDSNSDLILYDVEKNEVSHIANDPERLETWPSWSLDGKMLYFASCKYKADPNKTEIELIENYPYMKYDLMRMSFDVNTRTFGKADTVFSASKLNKSASFPRVSPDGKYLLFTLGDFGNFHIWHKSSDLYLLNLQSGDVRNMTEINSNDVDSYHSWSSNGRWIIFSTRRDDGSYTRSYISYFDKSGKATKPFILPQKDPDFYGELFKSFNLPEFMVEPVKVTPREFYNAAEKDPIQASYKK